MLKKYRNSPTARLPLYYLNLRYGYLIIKCEEISWKNLISERVSSIYVSTFVFIEIPLFSWSTSTNGNGIISVQWSRSRPSVFYVLDINSNLHIW